MFAGKKNEPRGNIKIRKHAGNILNSTNQNSKLSNLTTKPKSEIPTPRSASKPIGTHHLNCVPAKTSLSLKRPPLNMQMKSLSLVELSQHTSLSICKKKQGKEQMEEEKVSVFEIKKICFLSSHRESKLAKKVYKTLILNAWRQRRQQVMDLEQKRNKLGMEVQNLNIQVTSLSSLFHAETLRVAMATSEASHLRARLESELRTVKELKETLSTLTSERKVWESIEKQLNEEVTALRTEVVLKKNQLSEIEKENKLYEEELKQLKEIESQLIITLTEMDRNLEKKDIALGMLQKKHVEYQEKIDEITSKVQALEHVKTTKEKQLDACNLKLAKMDVDLNNLQNTSTVQNIKIKDLTSEIVEKNRKLQTYERHTEKLQHTVEIYKKEKERFTSKCKDATLSGLVIFLRLFLNQAL